MITDFLKTNRPKSELKIALDILREFKSGESEEEWLEGFFIAWTKLEQFEEFLSHLIDGEDLKA